MDEPIPGPYDPECAPPTSSASVFASSLSVKTVEINTNSNVAGTAARRRGRKRWRNGLQHGKGRFVNIDPFF